MGAGVAADAQRFVSGAMMPPMAMMTIAAMRHAHRTGHARALDEAADAADDRADRTRHRAANHCAADAAAEALTRRGAGAETQGRKTHDAQIAKSRFHFAVP